MSLSFEGFWVRTSQTSEVGLAFPSVLCADTPWRFFIGLARDEVLFRRYEEDLQAATGVKLGQPGAKHGETKVSKKIRKRRQQVQHQQEPSRSPG